MHERTDCDITLCILFAWGLGLVAHFPAAADPGLPYRRLLHRSIRRRWVESQESIQIISELGLIFMLFMIGLEIDLKKIVRAGPVILFAAGGQLLGGCLLGVLFFAGIGMAIGGGHFDAVYLCVACALSSTVIIVKVLYEKRELDTLPGRITLGVLVLQDIFAILFLAVQPSLGDLQIGVFLLSIAPRRRAGGDRAGAQPLCAALAVPPHRAHAGTGDARRAGLVLPDRRDRRAAASVARDGLAGGRRLALDLPLRARRHRQGDDAAGLLHHAVLRRAGHDDSDPQPVGDRAGAVDRRLHRGRAGSLTTFVPLYLMKQGLRASLLPAINLAQISEFSLVVIQTGIAAGHIGGETANAISFAFVVLAVLLDLRDGAQRRHLAQAIAALKRIGLRDLDHTPDADAAHDGEPWRRGGS